MNRETIKNLVRESIRNHLDSGYRDEPFEEYAGRVFKEELAGLTESEVRSLKNMLPDARNVQLQESESMSITDDGDQTWVIVKDNDLYIIARKDGETIGSVVEKGGEVREFPVTNPAETVDELVIDGGELVRSKDQLRMQVRKGGWLRSILRFIKRGFVGGSVSAVSLVIFLTIAQLVLGEAFFIKHLARL